MDTVQASEAGECPSSYKACSSRSEQSAWYDVYCVAEADYPQKCPILSVDIVPVNSNSVSDNEKNVRYEQSSDWELVSFTADYNLWYTKTDSEKAPLGKTFVGRQPCLDPSQVLSFDYDDYLYELEKVDEITKCDMQIKGYPDEDSRYSVIEGYSISLFDIQMASGIQDRLNSLKEYEVQVPDFTVKKTMMNKFYTRPVVAWTCSRDKMLDAISTMQDVDVDELESPE